MCVVLLPPGVNPIAVNNNNNNNNNNKRTWVKKKKIKDYLRKRTVIYFHLFSAFFVYIREVRCLNDCLLFSMWNVRRSKKSNKNLINRENKKNLGKYTFFLSQNANTCSRPNSIGTAIISLGQSARNVKLANHLPFITEDEERIELQIHASKGTFYLHLHSVYVQ
jgi:hypothetical protein